MNPTRLPSLVLSRFLLLCLLLSFLMPAHAESDPSGRVGRISLTSGQVDFRDFANDWSRPALVNWPVVAGNVISTLRFARAEIQIGSTALRLEAESELEIKVLDDFHMVLRLNSGSVHVKVPNPDVAPQFELLTSQGRLLMQAPSQVRVDFALRPDSTSVRLFNGSVRFESSGAGLLLQPGQQLTLRQNEIATTNFTRDDFDAWSLALDQPQVQSTQYVSSEITGYQELDRNGDWQVSDEHGPLWYPRETPDNWAPYRYGSWTWVAPWGWTWVDHASWGYAPFHYGRWIWYRQRWAWAPGPRVERPVWSPAMVGWVHHHTGSGTALGSNANIGWYPLCPGEIYQPAYTSSFIYYRNVNGRLVGTGTTRRGNDDYHRHDRNGALTSLPQAQFSNNTMVVVQPAKPAPPPRNTIHEPPKTHASLNIGPIPPAKLAPGAPPAAPTVRNHPQPGHPAGNGDNAGNNAGNHSGRNPGNNAGNNPGNNAANHGVSQYSGVTVTPGVATPGVATPGVATPVPVPQVTGPVRNTVTEPPRPTRPANQTDNGMQPGNSNGGHNTVTDLPRQPSVPGTPPVRNTVIEGQRPVVTTAPVHQQQPDPRQPATGGTPAGRNVVPEVTRPTPAVQPAQPSVQPALPAATPQPARNLPVEGPPRPAAPNNGNNNANNANHGMNTGAPANNRPPAPVQEPHPATQPSVQPVAQPAAPVRNTVREAPSPHQAAPAAPAQVVQPAAPVARPQPVAPVQVAPPQPPAPARPAAPPAEAKPAAASASAKASREEPRQPKKDEPERR